MCGSATYLVLGRKVALCTLLGTVALWTTESTLAETLEVCADHVINTSGKLITIESTDRPEATVLDGAGLAIVLGAWGACED